MNEDQLSQKIEREVRQLIGDLQMQVIVLRAALQQAQQHPQEQPKPPPQPIPPQPEQPPPEPKATKRHMNGARSPLE